MNLDFEEFSSLGLQEINHFWTMIGSNLLCTNTLLQSSKNIIYGTTPNKNSKSENKNNEEKTQENKEKNNPAASNFENNEKIIQDRENVITNTAAFELGMKKTMSSKDKQGFKVISIIKYVINVLRPQINLYYQSRNSQMLLSSNQDCFIVSFEKYLPYDKLRIDAKLLFKIFFRDLDCLTAQTNPNSLNKINWRSDNEKDILSPDSRKRKESEKREGVLTKVMNSDFLSVNLSFFNLSECEINFAELLLHDPFLIHNNSIQYKDQDSRFYWDEEPRMSNVQMKIGKLISSMDSQNYQIFRNIVDFLFILVSSEERNQEIEKENNELLSELKIYSDQVVLKKIEEKISSVERSRALMKSGFEYSIDLIEHSMVKNANAFLKIKLDRFKGVHSYFLDESSSSEMLVKKIMMNNLLELEGSEYRNIAASLFDVESDADLFMFRFKTHCKFINGMSNYKWRVYETYEINLVPLIFKLTEQIYLEYYLYIFQIDEDLQDKSKILDKPDAPEKNKKERRKTEKV